MLFYLLFVQLVVVSQSISKLNRISLNFCELLEFLYSCVFLCILVLTTQKGVLFVAFDEFVEVAGYFHIVTTSNNKIAICTTPHRIPSHFPRLKLVSIDGVTAA